MIRSIFSFFLTDSGDWRLFLQNAADAGANCIRLPLDYLDGDGNHANPFHLFEQVGIWNPYALAGEAGYPDVPIFDITKKDEPAWAHLREVLIEMKRLSLIPWFVFQDRCSIAISGWQRFLNSFYSNIQRYPGWNIPHYYDGGVEAAIGGSLIGQGLNDYYWQYEKWIIDLCYELGIIELYGEPMNECGAAEKDESGHYIVSVAEWLQWLGWRMDSLKNLKYSKRIISIREPLSNQLIAPICDLVDAHWILEASDIPIYAANLEPKRTILDADGAMNGAGPHASVFGQRSRSIAQARSIGSFAREKGYAGFAELAPEQISDANGPWNTDCIDYAPLLELSLSSGWEPSSYLICGKSRQQQRSDEAKIEKKEESCFEKYIADRPISKWQIGEFIRCIFSR
jgi:hypothetical protein